MRYSIFHLLNTNPMAGLAVKPAHVNAGLYHFITMVETESPERLFRIANGVDGSDIEIIGRGRHFTGLVKLAARSLMVGDVIVESIPTDQTRFNKYTFNRGFLVAPSGWKSFNDTKGFETLRANNSGPLRVYYDKGFSYNP